MRAVAYINTTGQDPKLGKLSVSKRVEVTGSTFGDTSRALIEKVLTTMDGMPDDQVMNWTDISISVTRNG